MADIITYRRLFRAAYQIGADAQEGTRAVAERPIPQKHAAAGLTARPIPLEDARLIEQIRSGHTEAYGELVRKYQDRVFNTCWRICGHLEDARDLTQEAFLKAFERLGSFRGRSSFYTWVFRVAVNLALTHRRKAARRRQVSLDESALVGTQAERLGRQVADSSVNDPAACASESELQGRLVQALQRLDSEYRAVVVLRDIEGLDYREISEILEIPAGTVKSRLHRARSALRDAILPV